MLKEKKHPSYTNVTISNRFAPLSNEDDSDTSGDESDSEVEEEEEPLDSIRSNQLDLGNNVMLTDAHPETSVVINKTPFADQIPIWDVDTRRQLDTKHKALDIAPGEGKIPTNLARDPNWDIDAFPHLFPDGLYGLNHARPIKLTTCKYLTTCPPAEL